MLKKKTFKALTRPPQTTNYLFNKRSSRAMLPGENTSVFYIISGNYCTFHCICESQSHTSMSLQAITQPSKGSNFQCGWEFTHCCQQNNRGFGNSTRFSKGLTPPHNRQTHSPYPPAFTGMLPNLEMETLQPTHCVGYDAHVKSAI